MKDMILAQDTYLTAGFKKNMNCLVVGVPGSGKTRGHILPNLLEIQESSAVLLDPKGELYTLTSSMMKKKGYTVKLVDFDSPFNPESCFYNPLVYCDTTDDIISLTHTLVAQDLERSKDIFWPNTAQIFANSLLGYLVFECNLEDRTLSSVLKLIKTFEIPSDGKGKSTLDLVFESLKSRNPSSWPLEQYELLKKVAPANNTISCIVMSLISTLAGIMSDGIKHLTSKDSLDIRSIGREKTVLYIKNSDSDRSRDKLVSILFQQIFKELFHEADSNPDQSLKVHTHLYLDDLGTNLTVENLDCYIAACRSREISMSVILQSVGQLEKQFGNAYTAILGSCASLVFLGSNDINTCYEMSLRLNKPLGSVLYKDINEIFVFTQGEQAKKTQIYDIKTHANYCLLNDFKESNLTQSANYFSHR